MKTLTAIEALKSAITLTEDLKKLEANGEHGRLRIVFEHHDKDLEQRVMALMERYHSTAGLLTFALKVAEKEQQWAAEAVSHCLTPRPGDRDHSGNVAPLRAAE